MSRCRSNSPASPTPSSARDANSTASGLGERLSHYPAQLSGGEQQRVALARALAPDPSILVADEPTGNLDEKTGQQVIELLFKGHVERGTTLILVTHDPALAARCDRVVRLRSGRIETADQPRGRRAHERSRRKRFPSTDIAAHCHCVLRCANCAAALRGFYVLILLHRARRDGDRRRRLVFRKPDRRSRARGPHHSRRRRRVLADPSRGERQRARNSCKAADRSRSPPPCARWRARRRTRCAGRDQGGRQRLSAVRHDRARTGDAARRCVGRARRCLRRRWPIRPCWRGSISIPARASRSALRPIEIRAALRNEPDKLAGGIGFGPRLLISEAALARDRPGAARQPGALALSREAARQRCERPRRGGARVSEPKSNCRKPAGKSAPATMPRRSSSAISSASRNS